MFILLVVAVTAALGGFLFGFDTAVINGAVQELKNQFNATDLQVGLSVSVALLGSAVGAFAAPNIADRIGRLRTMQISSILFVISAVGSGLPIGLYDFIFWRVVGGVAVGAASVIAPTYIAEISPARLRGRLGSLQQLAIVTGIFIALFSNLAIVKAAGSAGAPFWFGYEAWRWMFWSEIPPALLYGIAATLIPESPRYLLMRGRADEARQILAKIASPEESQALIADAHRAMADRRPTFHDLKVEARGFRIHPIVWVGIALSALQQFVGINVIFYYSSTLWRSVGFGEEDSLRISVFTGIVNIITTLIAISFVDKLGRRPLLIIGSVGMALSLGVMAYAFGVSPVDEKGLPVLTGALSKAALVAANLYVFFFGLSWGPVMWVMLGEMFPARLKGPALSIAGATNWVSNFAVSALFPIMARKLGLGISYGIYAAMAAFSLVIVLRFVKETKGRSLEDM